MNSEQGKQIETNDQSMIDLKKSSDAKPSNGYDDGKNAETEKYRHTHYDARHFFPLFYLNFWFRIVGGLLAFMLGICLLVSGSWADSGTYAFLILQSKPFPNVEIEDGNWHSMALEFASFVGWICGFFLLLGSLYYFWTAFVLYELYFAKKPWNKERWSDIRVAANDFLVTGRVREETLAEQFARMNEDQQEDMVQYKRTPEADNKDESAV